MIVSKSGGVTSTKAVVLRWLKQEIERVKADDPRVEFEMEKMRHERESPATGVLVKILARETGEVPMGAPLAQNRGKESLAALQEIRKASAMKTGRELGKGRQIWMYTRMVRIREFEEAKSVSPVSTSV